MSFIEERFPLKIAYGSTGGPQFSTRIVTSVSGYEDRNRNWQYPIHTFNAASGVKTYEQLEELIAFFNIVEGRAYGFRWPHDVDDRSCSRLEDPAFGDQVIGAADGATTAFQLKKTYVFGSSTKEREITKPVAGTVLVGVDGVEQTSGWSVNTTTGVVTFSTAPTSGDVTAGFKFDVPCRFATDVLDISIDHYQMGTATVPVVEIRV